MFAKRAALILRFFPLPVLVTAQYDMKEAKNDQCGAVVSELGLVTSSVS